MFNRSEKSQSKIRLDSTRRQRTNSKFDLFNWVKSIIRLSSWFNLLRRRFSSDWKIRMRTDGDIYPPTLPPVVPCSLPAGRESNHQLWQSNRAQQFLSIEIKDGLDRDWPTRSHTWADEHVWLHWWFVCEGLKQTGGIHHVLYEETEADILYVYVISLYCFNAK